MPKKTVFLHIGMPKAGSTSIQHSFHGYDDGTVRYARLGHACHSLKMVCRFSQDPETSPFLRNRRLGRDEIGRIGERCGRELEAEIAEGREGLVISGEALCALTRPDIAAIRAFVEHHGYRLEVIAYVREPVGFASSSFQQTVKVDRSSFDLRRCRPLYRRKFEGWVDVVGAANIRFVAFDRDRMARGSIVPDFALRVGADPDRVAEVRANDSLAAAAVSHLYFWNRENTGVDWSPEGNLARAMLVDALAAHFPGRFRLAEALVDSIRDGADLAWMESVSGLDLRPTAGRQERAADGDVIGSEGELEAVRDASVGGLAALAGGLGIAVPERPTSALLMGSLDRHFRGAAREEVRRRKAERAAPGLVPTT